MRLHSVFQPIRLLFAALIVVGLALLWSAPVNTLSRWPAARQHTKPLPAIVGRALPAGQLTINVAEGLYAEQREALESDLLRALGYVATRFGSGPHAPLGAAVLHDEACALHGVAYTDVRSVQVFTCASIGRERAVAIVAHEIVHQLAQDRYGPAHLRADLILSEGVATWAAGEYWLSGRPDFRSYVREQRQSGLFYPLATHYEGLGTAAMNALYYEWASFVDFLIGTYGREKFDLLYVSGHNAPGSADYSGVYGKGLDTLEREWQAWLDA